jgi:hypothetical protein
MLNSLSLLNFKSFQEATLPLAPLSLLIGANASGKSNAIEGIRFLSWLAEGRRLDDLMSAVQSQHQRVRGTIRDLVYCPAGGARGTDQPGRFGFRCSIGAESSQGLSDQHDFEIQIEVTSESMRVISETIATPASSVPLYVLDEAAKSYSHEVLVRYNNVARGGIEPKIPCTGKNQQRDRARAELRHFFKEGANLLLPLAAIYETGRHIS